MLILIDDALRPIDSELQTAETPFGSVDFHLIDMNEKRAIVLYRSPEQNPKSLAYAARALGGSRVISLVRDGGVERPSTPTNFIEFTSGRATTFFEAVGTGYVQQNPPFCAELSGALLATDVQETGNLLVLDTLPAPNIRAWWQAHNINLISTHTQPEGALCRELELCYAVLALPEALSLSTILPDVLAQLPTERSCDCDQTMAMARKFGKITADWFERL